MTVHPVPTGYARITEVRLEMVVGGRRVVAAFHRAEKIAELFRPPTAPNDNLGGMLRAVCGAPNVPTSKLAARTTEVTVTLMVDGVRRVRRHRTTSDILRMIGSTRGLSDCLEAELSGLDTWAQTSDRPVPTPLTK